MDKSTRQKFLFYTGKGGVGKTTLACAMAVKLAEEGRKVLLISTDPASNLKDVLESKIGDTIQQHFEIPNLFMVNIDPEKSAQEYRKRVLEPLKETTDNQELAKIEEGLSGACTTEIASFDEFSRFITGEGEVEDFDIVIFDTAPTGHTIRLLELPAAWDSFLEKNPQGASCIGPSSALKSSKERYKRVIESLRDPQQTVFHLVTRTDTASLKEAARTSNELKELGFSNQQLSINGVFSALDESDSLAKKMQSNAQSNLNNLPPVLVTLGRTDYPLLPYNILGVEKLRSIYDKQKQAAIIASEINHDKRTSALNKTLKTLVNELEKASEKGLIMTMGKGGVGKTIVAASIATLLAIRGHKVLLTTTDPAAHVNDFINQLDQIPENLEVERIDPKAETKIYMDRILKQKGEKLDEAARSLLREDLKSPCSEEVAVFSAFSKAIHKAKHQYVVMDTAPTGHTLLLLDTTGSYHKEVMKTTTLNPSRITTPYMSLQDENFAKIILVALPETTPMREAEDLQNDLKRAGIEPHSWVINQSLSILENLSDPILVKRAQAEVEIINRIKDKIAQETFLLPFIAEEQLLPAIIKLYG
jgi:arsenite-transporting ATPase